MSEYLELTYIQVGLAALLILINGAISVTLRLGLAKSLLIASVRTVTQLLLIGLILEWIFHREQPHVLLIAAVFMSLAAGLTASSRLKRSYSWIWVDTCLSMWASSWLVGLYALAFVFHGIKPWYSPQFAIPLLGMILGNTLNGISIGLDSMLHSLATQRNLIEMRLSHGANRWEATRSELQAAVKAGMIPIINSMMIVGIVSLPGMMTGQLLSGTSPIEAVKYQIAILFLIASATALGTVAATTLALLRTTNRDHQLQFEKLR